MQALKIVNKSSLNCGQAGILGLTLTVVMTAPAWSETSLKSPSTTADSGVEELYTQAPTPTESPPQPETTGNSAAQELDLSPELIEGSPVLQRWLEEVPNVLDDIRNDPSFRTRVRLGYSQFPQRGKRQA